jgi:hypothetical protein
MISAFSIRKALKIINGHQFGEIVAVMLVVAALITTIGIIVYWLTTKRM